MLAKRFRKIFKSRKGEFRKPPKSGEKSKGDSYGSSQEKKKSDFEIQFRPSYLNGVFVSTHEHLSKNRNNNKNIAYFTNRKGKKITSSP